MGKVNVYLPDDLERAVRNAGLSVSAICQSALQDSLERLAEVRAGGRRGLTVQMAGILEKARSAAIDAGRQMSVYDLFGALLDNGDNLATKALTALGIELPAPGQVPRGRARRGDGEPDAPTRDVLAAAFRAAVELRHPAIGPEHVLIALAEAPSPMEAMFRALGLDSRRLRRQLERLILDAAAARADSLLPRG